jgi:hypothetical protein
MASSFLEQAEGTCFHLSASIKWSDGNCIKVNSNRNVKNRSLTK